MNWRNRIAAALGVLATALGGLALYAVLRPDAAISPPGAGAPAAPLGINPAAARIRTAPLAFATAPVQSIGQARALDLAPLAAFSADVAADPARLEPACRRAVRAYGPGLARLGCGALPALAQEAAAGQLALLRLDFPAVALPAGTSVTLDLAPGVTLVRVLGPAAPPSMPRAGYRPGRSSAMLAVLRGDAARQAAMLAGGPGIPARVSAGAVQAGLLVPRTALVRVGGGLFVWHALPADTYERLPLEGAVARADGWFVPAGRLKAGDRVVVAGADILLALERGQVPETR